jgi:membrane-associated phospholipid phosphatase
MTPARAGYVIGMPRRRALLAYVPAAVAYAQLRRKIRAPRPLSMLVTAAAPAAVRAALPPGRPRAAAVWAAQMWAYKVNFEIPYDRPEKLHNRLRVDAPLRADTFIGRGVPPSQRLQRRLRRPPELTVLDRAVSGLYYTWEAMPHVVLASILLRDPERFGAAAARLGATFDLTLLGYWAFPSAPPWWASEREGRMDREVRRVTFEVAADLRGRTRPRVDHNSGSNPWAAMPSDHFASAVMSARLLADFGPPAAALGAAYALALGATLVYTGEHYVVDLLAGLALAAAVEATARAFGA